MKSRWIVVGAVTLLVAASLAAGRDTSGWKRFHAAEYAFEIAYPADWDFDADFPDNYGKPPSGNRPPAYAGETRNLFRLEKDGPERSHEGGGYFEDGAIVTIRITGTSGDVEDWNVAPGRPWHLVRSTPSDWVELQSSAFGGDGIEKVNIDTNGFTGTIEVACNGLNPCKRFGEIGGAYRTLRGGRVLLVSWERMTGVNDYSREKFFLPMLASFKSLK